MVWVRYPKHKHHCVKVVWCTAASAIYYYHSGASCRVKIMERLSIRGDVCTREAAHAKDSKRLTKSDMQVTQKEKRRRQGEQLLRTHREEALREAEGVTYEPGGF